MSEVRTCPKCQTENELKSAYCFRCGEQLGQQIIEQAMSRESTGQIHVPRRTAIAIGGAILLLLLIVLVVHAFTKQGGIIGTHPIVGTWVLAGTNRGNMIFERDGTGSSNSTFGDSQQFTWKSEHGRVMLYPIGDWGNPVACEVNPNGHLRVYDPPSSQQPVAVLTRVK